MCFFSHQLKWKDNLISVQPHSLTVFAGAGVYQRSGLYNNPALIQDGIKPFKGLHFEKSIAANISSLLIGDISKDTSGLDLK